jgi:hypothetical protein
VVVLMPILDVDTKNDTTIGGSAIAEIYVKREI